MTRRKGERTDKHRHKSHPFQVAHEMTAGPIAYEIMSRWASWFDFETTGNGLNGMCWCFCRRDVADAFATDFGGTRIDRPIDIHCLVIDQPSSEELERRAKASRIGLERVNGGRPLDTTRPFREAAKIPFSSFNNPTDVARAQGALDTAWLVIKNSVAEADQERERARLAYIVASFALVALDDDDLARRAVERFRHPPAGR